MKRRELVHELTGVDEVERPDPLLDHASGLVEQRQVGLDLAQAHSGAAP